MVKDEYESWVRCFEWTEQEKVAWLLNAVNYVEQELATAKAALAQEAP